MLFMASEQMSVLCSRRTVCVWNKCQAGPGCQLKTNVNSGFQNKRRFTILIFLPLQRYEKN